jgi:hypothetical protein
MNKFDNKNENIKNLDKQILGPNKLNLTELTFQDFIHKLKSTMASSKKF